MQIQAAGKTDVGKERELNEDNMLVDSALCLFVVCDGMGGHAAGEIASKTAAATVQKYVKEREATLVAIERGAEPLDAAVAILREAIETASQTIFDFGKTDRAKKGMGTTCTALLVLGGKGVLGHVGDSRCYLVRQGKLYQLSEDHTFLQEAIRYGMMTPQQAKESSHSNIITRAVGPMEKVIVDTLTFDIVTGDTLLLCSDGLHGYLGDGEELPGLLGEGTPASMCERFIGLANERGGGDNITAVVVRAEPGDVTEKDLEVQRFTLVSTTFDTLQHVDLFAECSSAEIVRVTSAFKSMDVAAEQQIIAEGEGSETLFVLLEGQVVVERGGQPLAVLGAGSHFGEMALLSHRPRSATVRAKTAARLLALDRPSFYTLLQQDAVLATKFLWKLAQTLSLRLDDFYLLAEQQGALANKSTLRFGLYPSPFNHEQR